MIRLILGCLWILSLAGASAELALTADSAAKMALQKNPELAAARTIVAEAEARARASGRLSNPELGLEVAGGQDFEGRVEIGVMQRFPITARLRLERNLSALDIERARLEVQEKGRQLEVATRGAYYDLAAARESIALAGRQAAVAKELAESLRSSAGEGLSSSLDAGQAVLTGEEFAVAREAYLVDEAVALGRLASLLGLPASESLTTKESLALPRSLPANQSIGFRPDLRLAEMAVESGAVDVSLAKASRWDDVGVGLFVEGERTEDAPEGIDSEALLGVRFNIPLPIWQNGNGKVAEKQAVHERQQKQLQALRLAALNEALVAYRRMAANHRLATQIENNLLPMAKKQVDDTSATYQRGEADMQTLSRARERLAQVEVSALEARKKFFLSRSEWLAAVGVMSKTP
jgi:outer membrane protein TolC